MSGLFWLKLKHGAPANPKWRMIAQKVGCPQGEVWTLYSWALDFAGQHDGSLAGFDLEEVAATTDYLLDELQRIWTAFIDKAIIVGETIHNWVAHQGQAAVAAAQAAGAKVKRTISTSTQRMRRKRDRARQSDLFDVTHIPPSHVTPFEENQAVRASHSSVTPRHTGPPPDTPLKDSRLDSDTPAPPFPPTRWGAPAAPGQQHRRVEGTNLRALGLNPRALQGEILLPIRGSPRWRMTRSEERQARNRAVIMSYLAKAEAHDGIPA